MARHRDWDQDEDFRTDDIDFGDDELQEETGSDDGNAVAAAGEAQTPGGARNAELSAASDEAMQSGGKQKGRTRRSTSSSKRQAPSNGSAADSGAKSSGKRRKKASAATQPDVERLSLTEAAREDASLQPIEPASHAETPPPESSEVELSTTSNHTGAASELRVESTEETEPVHVGGSEPKDCGDLPPDNTEQIQVLRRLGCRVDVDAHGHVWRIFLYERNKDNALAMIHDFPCLKELWLFGARVSAQMVDKFRELHPKVSVYI